MSPASSICSGCACCVAVELPPPAPEALPWSPGCSQLCFPVFELNLGTTNARKYHYDSTHHQWKSRACMREHASVQQTPAQIWTRKKGEREARPRTTYTSSVSSKSWTTAWSSPPGAAALLRRPFLSCVAAKHLLQHSSSSAPRPSPHSPKARPSVYDITVDFLKGRHSFRFRCGVWCVVSHRNGARFLCTTCCKRSRWSRGMHHKRLRPRWAFVSVVLAALACATLVLLSGLDAGRTLRIDPGRCSTLTEMGRLARGSSHISAPMCWACRSASWSFTSYGARSTWTGRERSTSTSSRMPVSAFKLEPVTVSPRH